MTSTGGHLQFQARVAANVLATVERELSRPAPHDSGDDWASLALSVRDRLAVSNPRHLER